MDNPLQDHLDLPAVYQAEFALLKAALHDIKADPNQQSKGTVVLGKAGAGKTYLIMHLAKERLRTNRLLFIRQPNNATAVLHYTYFDQLESLGLSHNTPILESFDAAVKELLTHVPNSLVILNLFPERWEQFQGFFDGGVVDRVSEHIIPLAWPSAAKLEDCCVWKSKSWG